MAGKRTNMRSHPTTMMSPFANMIVVPLAYERNISLNFFSEL